MSWSENRTKSEVTISKEKIFEKIKNINAVLEKLAKDDDFQDDLRTPDVKRALDHWTGRNRLATEEAMKLQENRRCIYVLQRLQMLQHVCHEANIAVPFDLMITGKDKLPEAFINSTFGELLSKASTASQVKKPESNNSSNNTSVEKPNEVKQKATVEKKSPSPSASLSPKLTVEVDQSPAVDTIEQTNTSTTTAEKKPSGPAPTSLLMLTASILVVIVSMIIVFISTQSANK